MNTEVQDEKASIRTSILSRGDPRDAAWGRKKDACGQPIRMKLAVIIVSTEHVLTPSIRLRRVIHLQQNNFVPLLLAQVPPSMCGTVEKVIRLSDIPPSNMVYPNQVLG